MTNPKPTPTSSPHLRLAEELKRKRPECIPALRALVNRKKAERKLKEEA